MQQTSHSTLVSAIILTDRMAITAIIWICIVVAVQQTQGKNPTEYKADSERFGDVEIIYVRNANGDLVEVIELYANKDFQVIKPTDEKDHVCLIRELDQDTEDDDKCYKRVPLTPKTDDQREDALEKCGDRKVYLLQKVDCSVRGKRACVTTKKAVPFCLREESYCTSFGWWQCKSWGIRCAESEIREIVEITCA